MFCIYNNQISCRCDICYQYPFLHTFLPLNEQHKELSKILHYFNINFKRNISSMIYSKLLKKAFMLINENKYGYKY